MTGCQCPGCAFWVKGAPPDMPIEGCPNRATGEDRLCDKCRGILQAQDRWPHYLKEQA